jgi:hypothetical protein
MMKKIFGQTGVFISSGKIVIIWAARRCIYTSLIPFLGEEIPGHFFAPFEEVKGS